MAAVTTVMRVQQLLLSRIEDTLKPYGLTFAAYEALRLLAFSRRGSLPMGKMGQRLMVHPASVTNAITRLEHRGLVERRLSPDDRRVVLATITPDGQALVREATEALNQASFSLPGLSQDQAAEVTAMLREVRVAADDIPPTIPGRPRTRPAPGESAYPQTRGGYDHPHLGEQRCTIEWPFDEVDASFEDARSPPMADRYDGHLSPNTGYLIKFG